MEETSARATLLQPPPARGSCRPVSPRNPAEWLQLGLQFPPRARRHAGRRSTSSRDPGSAGLAFELALEERELPLVVSREGLLAAAATERASEQPTRERVGELHVDVM